MKGVAEHAGIEMASGTLNISGGTVEGTENDTELADSYSAMGVYDGSAIVVSPYDNVAVNITGGTVTSTYSYAIRMWAHTSYTSATVEISGGTVTGALGESNSPAYVYIPSAYTGRFTATDNRS
ncbi:MAG: hypothetical protein LUC83_07635 [Clostridiales bacterium]|nr:hypothetical protein [Clostridiales bacterium]